MRKPIHGVLIAVLAGGIANGQQDNPPYRPGEVVVHASPDLLAGMDLVKYLPHGNLSVIRVPAGQERIHAEILQAAGLVASINREAHANGTVNDTFRGFQWHFDAVQSDTAWDITTGGSVVVAVLDTGLATAGASDGVSSVAGTDIVNGDNDPTDGDGHGTHVSGTIAQTTNNNNGSAGLAYGARVMPVKVLDDTGNGSFADISSGVYYAVDNGASVINMSLSTNARFNIRNDPVMDAALDYAMANGVTVVCASGNDGNRKQVGYPAIYPTTIGVGATDYRNVVVRYSNFGTGLDMVAPGGDLGRDDNGDGFGDGVLQETFSGGSWGHYFFQGTSMASPHVAAAAALIYANDAGATPSSVFADLTGYALDIGNSGFDSKSGYGLLQCYNSLTRTSGGNGGCVDADGDGFCVEDGDCDDNNNKIFPGQNDTRGKLGRNGIDNDCNGIIDG